MTTAANPCPICGQHIAERPRGSRHGYPPKTCSVECRKERTRRMERARYYKIKDTTEYKAAYTARLRELQQRLRDDPEFYAIHRAYSAARTRRWREKAIADTARHEELKASSREYMRNWRAALESDPVAWEAHKAKCRAWYANLSAEQRAKIYPRRPVSPKS